MFIPQDQTVFAGGESGEPGNCWAASIASIVGFPIHIVPNFVAKPLWLLETQRWLNSYGWGLVKIPWPKCPFGGQFPPSVVVLSGWGPRGVGHSVVGRVELDKEGIASLRIIHDPHPSRAGLDLARGELYVSFLFQIGK